MTYKAGAEWKGNAAGRPKGSKNKRNEQISAACEKYGFHPIEWHILIARDGRFPKVNKAGVLVTNARSKPIDPGHRISAGRAILDKLYPNLKSVEVEQDTNFIFTIRKVGEEK